MTAQNINNVQPEASSVTRASTGGAPSEPKGGSTPKRAGIILAAVGALVAGVIYTGVHSRVKAATNLSRAAEASSLESVSVTHAKSGSDAQEIVLPGTTQAYTDTPIYARTSGYLRRWYADIGSHVKKGQLLAEIETPELDQQLQQAENELRSAQADLQLATITANRWKHLLETDSVSKQETDQAVSDLQSKEAQVASKEANVRRLQQLQSYERIFAPFDGVITARNTDVGALIAAGDNSASRELFHLAAINSLRVYVSVPEVYQTAVHDGEQATLTLDAFPGRTFRGILTRNSNAIDLNSRTLNVEVDVDNSSGLLLPGAYAFVHLQVPAASGALTIPANTILFRSEGLRVGVVRGGRIKLVPISVGHDYGNRVEVIAGVTTQDALVVDPSDSLEEGAPVRIAGEREEAGR